MHFQFRVTKVIGYQPPELLGKPVFDFFHPEDQAHMRESFEQGTLTAYSKFSTVINCGVIGFILYTTLHRAFHAHPPPVINQSLYLLCHPKDCFPHFIELWASGRNA